jgi:hypothetical protein
MWGSELCTDSLVPGRAQALNPGDPKGQPIFGHASWAPGSCHSYSLPRSPPPAPTERCAAMNHVGNFPSSWYSDWTSPLQLPGNSQVCSSPQFPVNGQNGPARYKRSCLLPPCSLILLLLLSYSPLPSLSTWPCPASASLPFSLSLSFYNKHLKIMDCLFSSGSAALEQQSRPSSRALLI